MKNSNINIIICGETNIGKSTIMEFIYQKLIEEGFQVQLNLENNDYKNEEDYHNKILPNLKDRNNNIKQKGTIITLSETHTSKCIEKIENPEMHDIIY